jgi:hypothetical protein
VGYKPRKPAALHFTGKFVYWYYWYLLLVIYIIIIHIHMHTWSIAHSCRYVNPDTPRVLTSVATSRRIRRMCRWVRSSSSSKGEGEGCFCF